MSVLISQKESLPFFLWVFRSSLLVRGLISRWLHVLSWQKNVRLSTQEASKGKQGAFFHPQVWQSNSSLETCKVSRETNWPFDTALPTLKLARAFMSGETFRRLSRTFIITILLTSQKPTLMLKLQHRPNSFKHSWIPITYMYIKDNPLFTVCQNPQKRSYLVEYIQFENESFGGHFLSQFSLFSIRLRVSPLTHWKNYGSL